MYIKHLQFLSFLLTCPIDSTSWMQPSLQIGTLQNVLPRRTSRTGEENKRRTRFELGDQGASFFQGWRSNVRQILPTPSFRPSNKWKDDMIDVVTRIRVHQYDDIWVVQEKYLFRFILAQDDFHHGSFVLLAFFGPLHEDHDQYCSFICQLGMSHMELQGQTYGRFLTEKNIQKTTITTTTSSSSKHATKYFSFFFTPCKYTYRSTAA